METLTTRIVDYCNNNDFYNFKDNVTDIKEFTNNVNDLLIFAPADIITYLKSNLDCGKKEKRELEKLINDINNISYQDLTMNFSKKVNNYSFKDIDLLLHEFLEKKLYKRFLCLSLAYVKYINIEKYDFSFIDWLANTEKININDLSIIENLDNVGFKVDLDKILKTL